MHGLFVEDKLRAELSELERTWDPFWHPPWEKAPSRPWQCYGEVDPLELLRWQRSRPEITPELQAQRCKEFKDWEKYFKSQDVARRWQAERQRLADLQEADLKRARECELDNFLCEGQRVLASFTDVKEEIDDSQAARGGDGGSDRASYGLG